MEKVADIWIIENGSGFFQRACVSHEVADIRVDELRKQFPKMKFKVRGVGLYDLEKKEVKT
jgi:hypothetical protein